jgi:hypothetical protein
VLDVIASVGPTGQELHEAEDRATIVVIRVLDARIVAGDVTDNESDIPDN